MYILSFESMDVLADCGSARGHEESFTYITYIIYYEYSLKLFEINLT